LPNSYDIDWVLTKILDLYANFWVLAEQGDKKVWFKVLKGIQSGLALTADLDSILNWATFMVAAEVAEEILGHAISLKSSHFGDDIESQFKDYWEAGFVFSVLLAMQVKTNIHKTWIGNTADEFLRQLSKKGKLAGYMNRVIPTILWRKPGPQDAEAVEGRFNSLSTNWATMIRRGANFEKCYRYAQRDIMNSSGEKRDVVVGWLNTPSAYGGAGWLVEKPEEWVELRTEMEIDESVHPYSKHHQISDLWGMMLDEGRWWADRVGVKKNVKYYFNRVKRVELYHPRTMDSVPLRASGVSPRWKEGTPLTGRGLWVREMIDTGNISAIEERLDPRGLSDFTRLRSHASKAVWMEWIMGKLSSTGCNTPFAGQMIGQPTGSLWVAWYHSLALRARKVTRGSLRRASAAAEMAVAVRARVNEWWQG
jgi:hypothetical protein